MSEELLRNISWFWILMALILFPILLHVTQPYGRHTKYNLGWMIDNNLGWFIMETPAVIVFLWFVFTYGKVINAFIILATALWCLHYFHRAFIYPLTIRTKGKKMPLMIVLSGIFFNLINGFLNGYWLALYAPSYDSGKWFSFRVFLGTILFLTGFAMNKYHDRILIQLRNNQGKGYKIPYGGLFAYVSCPNFLGEIITWTGFFVVTFSWPAFSFLIWSIVNLVPRALDHHRWYRNEFMYYPENRKAIIPGLL
jgi:hypothetical protein